MDPQMILKQYFGYDGFREGQRELIDCILAGGDVLGIMPTGAGKSICYQVPALIFQGITIVISPLISLMKDQVYSLSQAGIPAAYINSSLSDMEIYRTFERAECGSYKILYIAPERLDTPLFLNFIAHADIALVAVDEAHCVSQWGQDFRPSYLSIAPFVAQLQKRPVLCAFTATATSEVKDDILCILGLNHPKLLITGFDRKNLYFAVKHVKKKKEEVLSYVKEHKNQCGIIYCSTRSNVDEVYELLCRNGMDAARYHAGMSKEERTTNQEDFIYDVKTVMVATNAFGMGIDKSNVRYVLHYNMPQCMENYYQEAGRAGRDGENSECILFYEPRDVHINKFLIENKESKKELTKEEEGAIRERDYKRLREMTFYCTTKECLRNFILKYFGERTGADCNNCSNCLTDYEKTDVTDLSRKILNCVYELRQRFGINIVVGVLRGSKAARILDNGFDKFRTYGTLAEYAESSLRQIIDALLQENMLIQTDDQYPVLRLGSDYLKLKDEANRVYIKSEVRRTKEVTKAAGGKKSVLTSKGYALFEKLRDLRMEIAKEENVPPYIVFSDKTLTDMCIKLPFTPEEMLSVNGVGQNKKEKYGKRFSELILQITAGEREGYSWIEPAPSSDMEMDGKGKVDKKEEVDRKREGNVEKKIALQNPVNEKRIQKNETIIEYFQKERRKESGNSEDLQKRERAAEPFQSEERIAVYSQENRARGRAKKKKEEFTFTRWMAERVNCEDACMFSEFIGKLNEQIDESQMKRLTIISLERKLEAEGYIHCEHRLRPVVIVEEKGKERGFFVAQRISQNGNEYDVLMMNEQAQRWLLEKVVEKNL